MAMKSSDKQATAELLAALVEVAIAHGRRHYSEGFVTVEGPGPIKFSVGDGVK